MGFEIVVGDDTYTVKLSDEPNWVFGLRSGDRIAAVGDDLCFVVAFSVWSTPNREAAYRAVEIAKMQVGSVRVCLLPYDYPEELGAWLPSEAERPDTIVQESTTEKGVVHVSISQKEHTSPIWLVVQDGETVEFRQGPLRNDEITRLLSVVAP
jgi:hypothetical protein